MIYTGQTGWLQGGQYGFIFDSTLNDFVSGELEHAIVSCWEETRPDLILLEGQSALRNPSGPCGPELLISGNAKQVILVHAPKRKYFDNEAHWGEIPPVETEIALIRQYGAQVLALALNTEGCTEVGSTGISAALPEFAGYSCFAATRTRRKGDFTCPQSAAAMKIKSIRAWLKNLALRKPYTIANLVCSDVENVFLEVELDNGIIGIGAANPAPEVVGETPLQCLQNCQSEVFDRLIGQATIFAISDRNRVKYAYNFPMRRALWQPSTLPCTMLMRSGRVFRW